MRPALCAIGLAMLAARPAEAAAFPADAGAIDVRDYGAVGDGQHDDTAALLAAIAASGGDTGPAFWQDRPVYLPDGTYLVSAPLLKKYAGGNFGSGLILVGQSEAHTIIRLADRAPGYDDPRHPRAIIFTTSKHIDGTPMSGGKDYPRLGEGNDAYMNSVTDLTVDAGTGNPGAIGIDYLANNIGAVRDVTLTAPAGSGAIGLSLTRKWPGPALIQRLTVKGFDIGIAAAQTEYGLTFDHIALTGQRGPAIRNDQNALTFRDLTVRGPGPALVNGGDEGYVAIDGGNLAVTGTSEEAIKNSGMVVARDLKIAGRDGALDGILDAGGPWKPLEVPAWRAKAEDAPADPASPPANWASVAKYGAVPDTGADATDGLRRAFASGADTIYLPHGTYLIDDAVEIPASVRRIVGMNSTIRIFPQRQPGFDRAGGMFRILSPGGTVAIENLAFDNTDRGDQLAVEVSGSRDVVLRDIISAGVKLLDRKQAGGRVFIENTCCGEITIAGPRPVQALQLDTEGGRVRIVNQGSPLSIVGLKTEGVSTIVDNRNGARTDIFGGLVYMVRDPGSNDVPAFRNAGSRLSASFAEEALRSASRYRVYLEDDTANGPHAVAAADFPERGLGRFVSSLSSDRAQ